MPKKSLSLSPWPDRPSRTVVEGPPGDAGAGDLDPGGVGARGRAGGRDCGTGGGGVWGSAREPLETLRSQTVPSAEAETVSGIETGTLAEGQHFAQQLRRGVKRLKTGEGLLCKMRLLTVGFTVDSHLAVDSDGPRNLWSQRQ